VVCASGTSHVVYLGGSVLKQNAQGISVYEQNDVRFALPSQWLQGGQQTQSGATYLFQSDKGNYRTGEPVKLKYSFYGTLPFTVDKIYLYDNHITGQILKTLTGAQVTAVVNHYLTISYQTNGEYYPMLRLVNSGETLSRNVYIGGGTEAQPNNAIIVSAQGSPLYVNTGAILGQYGGTGGVVNTNGIFSLNFKPGFGTSGNVYIDTAQGVLSPVMWALWWVSQKMYAILSSTTIFKFLFDMIHPINGSCYQVPQSILLEIPTPEGIAGTPFCISYTTEPNAQYLTKMLQIVIGVGIIFWMLNMFIPNRRT